MVSVDSTSRRAHQHAAGALTRAPRIPGRRSRPARHRSDEGLGRSRGGLNCKIHLASAGGRRPLALVITPGQWGDAPQFIPVLEQVKVPRPGGGRPRTRPDHVGGDKAYSSRRNRRYLRRRQIKHTIPEPRDQRANRQRRGSKGGLPPASTQRSTGAAMRSNAPSTGSRRSARSPRATTRGPTSSTGRSRSRRSGSGSARDRHVLAYRSSGTRTPSSTSSKTRGHQASSSSNTTGSLCRARSSTSST